MVNISLSAEGLLGTLLGQRLAKLSTASQVGSGPSAAPRSGREARPSTDHEKACYGRWRASRATGDRALSGNNPSTDTRSSGSVRLVPPHVHRFSLVGWQQQVKKKVNGPNK
jgi:hypothetical protein